MTARKRTSAERRRGQRQHRKQQVRAIARAASAALGCSCGSRLELEGGVGHVHCMHENDCPLADGGRQLVVWFPSAEAS